MWKWFEDRTGKWSEYSAGNNKTIDDAFVAGEPNVRFTASRRRYCVTFSTMLQVRTTHPISAHMHVWYVF